MLLGKMVALIGISMMLLTNAPLADQVWTSESATQAVQSTAPDSAAPPASTGGSIWVIVGYIAFFGIAIYFLVIRPQRKRDKDMNTLRAKLKTGDDVVTSTGMYGKIVDIGENVYTVEFGTGGKSIRVPIRKSEIIANETPNFTSGDSEK